MMHPSQTAGPTPANAPFPQIPAQQRSAPAPQQADGGGRGQGASGALSSFVTHAKALETLDRRRFPEEYAEHASRIRELRPLLRAHGILDVMDIKNPEVAALIES